MAVTINGTSGLTLESNGSRITGDFSNTNILSRTMFQTRIADDVTNVFAIPNGTGTAATFGVLNSNTANYSAGYMQMTSSAMYLVSDKGGTGSYQPLVFNTGGVERMRIDTSGNVTIANNLAVTGNATFSNTITVTGNTSITGKLTVTGNATFSNTVTVAASGITFSDATVQTTAAPASPAALSTASGSAPSYSARAWVKFNGINSPPTIIGSGNVSGVTKNSTGNYTINFTTAMPDTNYCAISTSTYGTTPDTSPGGGGASFGNFNTANVQMTTALGTSGTNDKAIISVVIFR